MENKNIEEQIIEILERYGVATKSVTIQTKNAISTRMMVNEALIGELSRLTKETYEQGARDFDMWLDETYKIGVDAETFLSQQREKGKDEQ